MLDLITLTIVISISGALSPGPLTISTITLSFKKGWKAGLYTSTGHFLTEFPYVILLVLFYNTIVEYLKNTYVKITFVSFISLFIFFFSYLIIKDTLKMKKESKDKTLINISNPILIGIIFTGLNPYFLLWWATVGFPIIEMVLRYGLPMALLVMYISHIWLDYIWLTGLSTTTFLSKKFIGSRPYKIIMLFLACFLIYLGIGIILNFFNIRIIP